MVAKPASIAPPVVEPAEAKPEPRLFTGVCSKCGNEDLWTHSGPCEKRCGGTYVVRDDTPDPAWTRAREERLRALESAQAALVEDECDECKFWGDDLYWSRDRY